MASRAERRAQGRCATCGKPDTPTYLCATCKAKAYPPDRCRRCRTRVAVPGLCEPCRSKHAADEQERYRQRSTSNRADGKCAAHGETLPCLLCANTKRRKRERVLTALAERDGAGCFYCGSIFAEQVDHVVPIHDPGGRSPSMREIGNLRLSCRPCNRRKSDRSAAEFVAELAERATPRALAAYSPPQ